MSIGSGGTNGKAGRSEDKTARIRHLRAHVRESFGKVTLALMSLPRYRDQGIGDLHHLVLAPLIRDRIAIAFRKSDEQTTDEDIVGIAIWAKVSDEVDAKIRRQIAANVWPIRLRDEDWDSGEIAWLLDVIAPDPETTGQVIGQFRNVVKEGQVRLHPFIRSLVSAELLERLSATRPPSQNGET